MRRRNEWAYGIGGVMIAIAWFVYNRHVDFGPYPELADAATYSRISQSFGNIGQAFTYSGDRTFGFPLFLYLVKKIAEIFGEVPLERLTAIQSISIFSIHVISSGLFYRALRDLTAKYGFRLHPVALTILLIHPGLVAHTSVLLTDTFSADLVMLTCALIVGARDGSLRSVAFRGAGAGVLLAYAVATRPFFVVTLLAILAAFIVVGVVLRSRRFAVFLIPLFVSVLLLLLPSVLNCRSNFGRACLQDPAFASDSAARSLQLGLTTYGLYWSMRSVWASGIVMPQDWSLVEHWKTSCDVPKIFTPTQWIQCVATRPFYFPVYLGKKTIALFDSFFLQPYATDVTPVWAENYNRTFSVLGFIGFFFGLAMCVEFFLRRQPWEAIALALPLFTLLFQLPMHVEPRYSFSAVPLSIFALVAAFQRVRMKGRRAIVAFLLVSATLGGTFLAQVHSWDLDDLILQEIERGNR